MTFFHLIGGLGVLAIFIGVILYDSCSCNLHNYLSRDKKKLFWKECVPILLIGIGVFAVIFTVIPYFVMLFYLK